ncbi:hypothetical protein BDF14DRAFT_1809138 [Spinellus fusiger]|nr:hypothetical protein BDF14DRAFT_1809138 [Spinellus fusiger]
MNVMGSASFSLFFSFFFLSFFILFAMTLHELHEEESEQWIPQLGYAEDPETPLTADTFPSKSGGKPVRHLLQACGSDRRGGGSLGMDESRVHFDF